MLAALERRGPDGVGRWEDPHVSLGHRRLAILDRSEAGAQPMVSASGRYVVSFNGEILNYRELCKQWGIDRAQLRSSSDTEVLLLAWERLGADAAHSFVGPFAFALYDKLEQRLWLVRDRLGERPLFYHQSADGLVFASTIEAVLQAPWISRELDAEALEEFVSLRYVLSPRTVIRGVKKLAPGQMLVVDATGLRTLQWWQPKFASELHADHPMKPRERELEFDRLLTQAVARCTVSDVPVGLLVSDGIDSNAIAFSLTSIGHTTAKYTFRADQGDAPEPVTINGDDVTVVEASLTVRSGALNEALSDLSEPVGDGAALASWLLLREARKGATVFLLGHGGDEICGGYRLSQDRFRLAMLGRLARYHLRIGTAIYQRYTYGATDVEIRRAALAACDAKHVPAGARFIIHQPLPQQETVALCGNSGASQRYLSAIDRLYQECAAQSNDLERMQSVLIRGFLGEIILPFIDSVAMAHSVEGRMPFLDRDLVEFSLAAPSTARIGRWPGYTNTKKELRRWAKPRLDPSIVQRHKRSFPYGALRQLLAARPDHVLAPLLDSQPIRRALPGLEDWLAHPPDYYRGPRDGTLWALLSLAAWGERVGLTA